MVLIVQKFGGTSVGTVERIQAVAKRIKQSVQDGNQVVVVVSAMGKSTDVLVDLANQVSSNPCRREMDMLLSTGEQVSIALLSLALQEINQSAISLTGAQVGIVTEAEHSRARILEICPDRLQQHLDEGKVVVVAGFQGISNADNLEITTLGRGGSDTSAVALAAALKAECCEIFTDVPGILTTDPRLVPDAQLMPEITCDEMLELASLGAKVLHPRAVEIARNYGIPLVVRSSWSDEPGTKVVAPPVQERSLVGLEIAKAVDGVEYDGDQAKVALLRVPDRPGVAAKLFQDISQREVDIDLIIQSIHDGNSNDIAYSVSRNLLAKAEAVTTAIAPTLKSSSEATDEAEIMVEAGIAKIAIAGAGMIGRPGIAAKMFRTLANAGINIEMISTSEVKVSCVIDQRDASNAINALNQAFGVKLTPPRRAGHSGALPVVRGVALDQEQAQIAIRFVPDRPGMAAKLFTDLADEGISVDMIIQSQRCRINQGKPCRDIAFMVAESNSQLAKNLLETLIQGWPGSDVVVNPAIAKVSIVGSGMVGQPGVAGHFFAALAKEGINIEMIATSEIKISCVVPQERGIDALRATHQAFGLSGEQNVIVPA